MLDLIPIGEVTPDHRFAIVVANWSLARMATTDRNVLRMGTYEIYIRTRPTGPPSTKRSNWPNRGRGGG